MKSSDEQFNYDSIAASYAENVDAAPYNALYERPAMLSQLPAVDGSRLLDAGCGSGWYAEQLLARGATVDAIDASAEMVGYARHRLARFLQPGKGSALTLQVARLGDALPFADACFDGIVSALVMHYIEDWRPALREMLRVLAPGGWLLFSTHHPAADALLSGTRDYFRTEHVVDNWEWVGRVEFYRRSFTEIHASLSDSGFIVERVVEPMPSAELKTVEPEAWERLMQQPAFLIMLVRRAH